LVDTDLREGADLDFAALDLTFEGFRALAQNPHLDAHGKIGFPTGYREGFEPAILEDICRKLPVLREGTGRTVADIGPGCAWLPTAIIELCAQREHRLILVDSPEMLDQLPDAAGVTIKTPGAFPQAAAAIRTLAPEGLDALICYSVLHYMYVEANLFECIDQMVGLLAPGGRALIGDIPNLSKRRRFFASPTGKAFHRAFTGLDEDPPRDPVGPVEGRIDDAVLTGLIQRAQLAGCDAYLLPQPPDLPMANRRDDLLIIKP
jgi:hypothetical protein